MTNQELAEKLRCVSSVRSEGPACEKCPFFCKEPVSEDLRQAVGEEFWASCDCDRVGQVAADALKNTAAHVAVLQKEIEDLRAQLATVQHQNEQLREANALTVKATTDRLCREWVSVKERLPEREEYVLMLVSGKFSCLAFDHAYMIGHHAGAEGWIVDEYPEWENPGVTHWMPLPDAPKEDA